MQPCDAQFQNHSFEKIQIMGSKDSCSFSFSPIDFCDDYHLKEINKAIFQKTANFNHHFILLPIDERKNYLQRSLVIIDVNTGIVYPLPIDFYSGLTNKKNQAIGYGKLVFDINQNNICINGSIFIYRSQKDGTFCFQFDGKQFSGYQTAYMINP